MFLKLMARLLQEDLVDVAREAGVTHKRHTTLQKAKICLFQQCTAFYTLYTVYTFTTGHN